MLKFVVKEHVFDIKYSQKIREKNNKGVFMKAVTVPYPEGLPQTLKLSDSEFAEEVRFLASAKLFELGKISSGKAAKMAGLDRVSFLEKLVHYKIPAINIQSEEIQKEIEAVKALK